MILMMSLGLSMSSDIYDILSDRLGLPNNGIRHWGQGPDHGLRTITLMKILFGSKYFYGIGVTVNPNVLLNGKETFDCIPPSDYRNFGTAFDDEIASIFGEDIFEYLPRYGTPWGCNSICYCMDVDVPDIDLILGLLRKTDIPIKNTEKKQMGFRDLLALDLVNPVTAEEVLIRSWNKVIGKGDFYTFSEARNTIVNSGISGLKKDELLEFFELLAKCGSIPATRDSLLESGEARSVFNKRLNGLRELGINGSLIPDCAGYRQIQSPLNRLESYFPSANDTLPFSSM